MESCNMDIFENCDSFLSGFEDKFYMSDNFDFESQFEDHNSNSTLDLDLDKEMDDFLTSTNDYKDHQYCSLSLKQSNNIVSDVKCDKNVNSNTLFDTNTNVINSFDTQPLQSPQKSDSFLKFPPSDLQVDDTTNNYELNQTNGFTENDNLTTPPLSDSSIFSDSPSYQFEGAFGDEVYDGKYDQLYEPISSDKVDDISDKTDEFLDCLDTYNKNLNTLLNNSDNKIDDCVPVSNIDNLNNNDLNFNLKNNLFTSNSNIIVNNLPTNITNKTLVIGKDVNNLLNKSIIIKCKNNNSNNFITTQNNVADILNGINNSNTRAIKIITNTHPNFLQYTSLVNNFGNNSKNHDSDFSDHSSPTLHSPTLDDSTSLKLSEEEKNLLDKEGISLPTNMPLTKDEERALKAVRRRIRNKISAKVSRQKKQCYVEGLEERVRICSQQNKQLHNKLVKLTKQNFSLIEQLKKMQILLSNHINNNKETSNSNFKTSVPAGATLMVFFLCFALFLFPNQLPLWNDNDGVVRSQDAFDTYYHANTLAASRKILQSQQNSQLEGRENPGMQLFGVHYDDDDGGDNNKDITSNEDSPNTSYTTYNGNDVDDYIDTQKINREDDDDSFGKCNGKRSSYYNYYFYNHNAQVSKSRRSGRDETMRDYEGDNGDLADESNSVVNNLDSNEDNIGQSEDINTNENSIYHSGSINDDKERIILNDDEFVDIDGINASSTYDDIEHLNQFLNEEIIRQAQSNESFIHISKTSNADILNNKKITDDVGKSNTNANKPTITIENLHKNEL